MKKVIVRSISVVILIAMMMSMSLVASAETTNAKAEIVFFGDSVTEAWGYDDFYFCQKVADNVKAGKSVFIGGYSDVIGVEQGRTDDILSAERVIYGNAGVRTYEVLIALGAGKVDESDPYYDAVSGEGISMAKEAEKNSEKYIKAVQSAKTIVIETGSDDVLYYAQMKSGLLNALGEIGTSSTEDILKVLGNYFELLKEGFDNFCRDYVAVIERIVELKSEKGQTINKDYQIVMVGAYNPVKGLTITSDMIAPVGDAISAITAAMNVKLREWEKEYGCKFADISNVETGAMTGVNNSFMAFASISTHDSCIATHPSHTEGYEYISRQVIAQLDPAIKKVDCNIRIDLGPVKSVSSVTVGTFAVNSTQYSFDPVTKILEINYLLPTATTCTVTSVDENGRIYVATYQLSYSSEKGYTPYLIYSTNDAVKTSTTVLNNVGSVTKTVGSALKSLFSK